MTAAQGARPYSPLSLSDSDMISFNCARLAVTNADDEMIGFAGVRVGANQEVSYDAGFVTRRLDEYHFSAPVVYARGEFPDPSAEFDGANLSYSDTQCQQQGGAEKDPVSRRVSLMHSYGMQPQGSGNVLRGALGWVRID